MVRLLLAAALALAPVAVAAAPSPSPGSSPQASAAEPKSGGMIHGHVVTVDYTRSVIELETVTHVHIEVYVMPSTSIQGRDNDYHTLIDVKTGSSVDVYSSIAGGKYLAQIIRLR